MRTVADFRHDGPLRILQSLYPEGDTVCHNVLIHPPGGLVGGDTLEINVNVAAGAHGLVTTPGASRFYRSEGDLALQHTRINLESGARLEWLPLEAICFSGCIGKNHLDVTLESGAEMIGWDVTALGLPNADKPFDKGVFQQHIELKGSWLERGRIDASDTRLLNSRLGFAGRKCLASIFFMSGDPIPRNKRDAILESARAVIDAHELGEFAGATCPNDRVIVVRVLAPVVEPAMGMLREVWTAWRSTCWRMTSSRPRIWSM